MLSLFELVACLLVTTATFAWLNGKFLRLPANVALLLMGLAVSLVLIAIEAAFPGNSLYGALAKGVRQIDFFEAVMHGMLAFLLFAGALQVDFGRLRRRAVVIGALATAGTLLSSVLVSAGIWAAARLLGFPLDLAWAFVFGTLIAPTDPVAVISTLKSVSVPKSLETDSTGEALFNDGIAIVLFTIALDAATATTEPHDMASVGLLLLTEAGGGSLLGLVTGYIAYRALRAIDDYSTEVLISLALVTATYATAEAIGVSAPISVVIAGVLIGNRGAEFAMSDVTKRYVFGFWRLVDELLNAVLFLLIGLEVLIIRFDLNFMWLGLLAVPLVVGARWTSVGIAMLALKPWQAFPAGTLPVLTWGGVRGGISIALALALPIGPNRLPLLAATYLVVLFTVLVQGSTLGWVVRRMVPADPAERP